MRPFSIRIFLPDGKPDGLRIIEKSNWTGSGVICPRSEVPEFRHRDEFQRPGVYVLQGPSEDGALPRVYVGEAEKIRPRLDQHLAGKDFWTTVCFFVSKDQNLNKAHAQYLESRLVDLAQQAKRCELENATVPRTPALSEADCADVEAFLSEMLLCLPIVGIGAFERPAAPSADRAVLQLRGKDAEARGYESADGFVVLEDSLARSAEVPSIHGHVTELRETLLKKGVFEPARDTQFRVTQDYEFNSPSQAAAVMMGRNANGRIEWKTEDGRPLADLQAAAARGDE